MKYIKVMNGINFDNMYSATKDGMIYSHKRNKFLKPFSDHKRGYMKVKLYDKDGIARTISVHRIVAFLYVPGFTNKNNTVNHINGDILDNYYTNLEWVDGFRNLRHAIENSISEFRKSQLQEATVHKICELLFISNKGPTEVSRELNIAKTAIDKISQGKNYSRISKLYKDCSTTIESTNVTSKEE